jgi:hypothetical protein
MGGWDGRCAQRWQLGQIFLFGGWAVVDSEPGSGSSSCRGLRLATGVLSGGSFEKSMAGATAGNHKPPSSCGVPASCILSSPSPVHQSSQRFKRPESRHCPGEDTDARYPMSAFCRRRSCKQWPIGRSDHCRRAGGWGHFNCGDGMPRQLVSLTGQKTGTTC